MNNPLSPVEIIYGIDKMQGAGSSDAEIIRNIARLAEGTARKVIESAGFAPDLVTDCYIPNDGLSLIEIRTERLEFERQAWHDLASLLIDLDTGGAELEAAALTLIEAGQLSYFLDTGQTEKAIISMANLLACGLLYSDQDKEGANAVLINRYKKQGSNGGKGKLGYENPIKKYIRKACKHLNIDGLTIKEAAADIIQLFEDDDELEVYQHDESCPIALKKYDPVKKIISYCDIAKPDITKTIDFDRLQVIIREIRNPKT